jgi:hypothetical protein
MCVLPGPVDRWPTKPFGRRGNPPPPPTFENQLSQDQAPRPQPARPHPVQFTWTESARPSPAPSRLSASRPPSTYVSHSSALLLLPSNRRRPSFRLQLFTQKKTARSSTDTARPLSPSFFRFPPHHLGDLSCTLVINLHQFFHPHPSSTRITRAFTSFRIDPRHCFPQRGRGITSPNHLHHV